MAISKNDLGDSHRGKKTDYYERPVCTTKTKTNKQKFQYDVSSQKNDMFTFKTPLF